MTRDDERLTIEDVASITGETREELRRWQRLGLLDDNETVGSDAIERARLVRFAAKRGVPPDDIAQICHEHGDVLAPFVQWATTRSPTTRLTPTQAAERFGLDADVVQRLWTAAGLTDQVVADEADLGALQLLKTALDFGVPLDFLLQMVRVVADTSTKAADTINRLFHLQVHEQFRSQGLRGADLMAATQSVADPLTGLVEPVIVYFHRKSWDRANRDDFVLHLIENRTRPGELVRAVLFVDLASYTPLTEAMGDTAAAAVLERFSDIVRHAAHTHNGQIVKQIGDEFMLTFADADEAVAFAVAVGAATSDEDRFPGVRIGAHSGPVLYREGDYFGATVNLAARVTGSAVRGEMLITDVLARELTAREGDLRTVGQRTLKGVTESVELFAIEIAPRSETRVHDPVCGMELARDAAAASLIWSGQSYAFCSDNCLRRFMGNPDRYTSTATA